jgi:radial spoke head protein 9
LELDRLVYTVRAIEVDCQTVPIGAYKMTPSHEMRYDDEFKGLSIKDSNCLTFYQHFRNPMCPSKQEMMMTEDVFFKFDFLDPVSSDNPKGCWSLQSDPSKCKVTLRSLLWPGYVSYHRANSKVFGGLYIGDGRKNVDLPFLL